MPFLSKRMQSYGLMLINTVLWSLPFIVAKPAYEITTPYRFLLYRYLLAVLCSVPILLYFFVIKKYKLTYKHLLIITGIEFIGSVAALALMYTGLKYVSAIEGNLLGASSPLLITLGGVILLKEREEKHEFIGLLFAFIGTILLIINPSLQMGQIIGQVSLFGSGLILLSHVLNMFYFPLMKKYYRRLPKLLVATISFYIAAIGFLILSWWEVGSVSGLLSTVVTELQVPTVLAGGIYMAIFASILGLTAYIKGQDGIEASEASLFVYLQPLIYIPVGVLWLKESVSVAQLAALGIITLGVYIASSRPRKSKKVAKVRRKTAPKRLKPIQAFS
jgi:drug/metabolite transporter (DMT)-like permease